MPDLRSVTTIEELEDREGLAKILKMSPQTIDRMRKREHDPMPSIKWGKKLIRYRPSDCMAWLERQQEAA